MQSVGLDASITDVRHGFYPDGDGKATLIAKPSELEPLQLGKRGSLSEIRIRSNETEDLAAAEVADRQVDGVIETLGDSITVPVRSETRTLPVRSTGTSVHLTVEYEHSTAGFSALGEPGLPAEEVGAKAAKRFLEFHESEGAVDTYLADQLLPFVASAGGRYTTPTLTDHVEAAIPVLEQFGFSITVDTDGQSVAISAK